MKENPSTTPYYTSKFRCLLTEIYHSDVTSTIINMRYLQAASQRQLAIVAYS